MKKLVLAGFGAVLVAGFIFVVSCGGDSDSSDDNEKDCPVGSLNCPCSNDACNKGLVCEASKCVEPSEDTETETEEPENTDETEDNTPTKSSISMIPEGDGKFCAEGTVVGPEDDSGWGEHWGAGIGVDLCKPDKEYSGDKVPVEECHNDLSRLIGFKITLSGTLPTELRINFEDNFEGNDDVVGDNGYIVAETLDEPVDYLFENAAVFYLGEDSRPELQPNLFTSLQFQVATAMGSIEDFSFCVDKVELILADEGPDAGEPEEIPAMDTNAECDAESLVVKADENNWVDQCTNQIGLQGHWYSYSD